MSEKRNMCERLMAEFTENYMEKLFYFCLRKTGNSVEAEDLTQDIALNILTALYHGTIPASFSAWVWQIARNRYSVWAGEKHQRTESVTGFDIGDDEIEDESENLLEQQIRSEELSLLRRELAFIQSDYRDIVVAYYIENKSVRDMASSLNLSVNAVQQRLHRAKIKLKEGMNMAREFGVRSYKPDEVYYTNNCVKSGDKNQPYSVMEHKLYQNILLETYGNPADAETLSLELGVALPYMEDELAYLTRETFLIRRGRKYETAFPIISRTAQERVHLAHLTAAPGIAKALEQFVDTLHRAFETTGFAYFGEYQDYESAKWTLLMLAYDHFMYGSSLRGEFTERPDHGRWDMIGFQKCAVREPNFVGNHGSDHGFRQFKYEFDGIADRTPPYLTEAESQTLYDLVVGKTQETSADIITALTKYGYLRQVGEEYRPAVLVLDRNKIKNAAKQLDAATAAELTALSDLARDRMKDLYDQIADAVKADLPTMFANDSFPCKLAISNCYHARGYVMAEALRSGWLRPANQVSPAIGAHFYLK